MQRSTALSAASSEARAPATHAAPAHARSTWVDAARGLGIVLVVAGHAIAGMVDAHLLDKDGFGARAGYFVYTFHMPLFFALAGLFIGERCTRGGFLRTALARIAWPYLLWSSLQSLVIASLPGLVNRGDVFDARRAFALLWLPASQFWFLHSLFVLQLLAWALVPRIGARMFLAVCIALRVVPELAPLPIALVQVLRFAPFFAAGVAAGPWLLARAGALRPRDGLALAAAAALPWLGAAFAAHAAGAGYWSAAALPAACAGSAACLALALSLRGAIADAAAALGRASMAVFVLHVLFVAGVRIVLHKGLGIADARVIFAVAVAAGIAGPVALRALAMRAGAARLLGLV